MAPFPKLRITMRPGYCAGLVAAKDDGLIFPRTIAQVPDARFLVVADMGGWDPKRGRVLLLDPQAAGGQAPQGAARRPRLAARAGDRSGPRAYVGTVDKILRFDPLAADPAATVETSFRGLPGAHRCSRTEPGSSTIPHPLKHFVFDRTGRIFVNIGAPSDACATTKSETGLRRQARGPRRLRAVWMFTPPPGGFSQRCGQARPGPKHEVFARGLRNSMALAGIRASPTRALRCCRAENARDIPDAARPNEEINVLERGKHYGWPYCHDLATVGPEYAAFLNQAPPYRNLCANAALYRRPHS